MKALTLFVLLPLLLWLGARLAVVLLSPPPATLAGPQRPLQACPGSPNCVSSTDPQPAIAPLSGPQAGGLFRQLSERIAGDGRARIVQRTDHYLHAEYRSRVFGFIDDLELRLADDGQRLDLRSASRLGYSDFGVNLQRLQALNAGLLPGDDT
ncbi:DUF1499 domain-containing protein [Granulosicoccaceae sp. 1_MG-2023]|nr:DUF1499 domain-containing protein [Granulosicoccaceae sp. 1_MG-2023]